MKMDAISTQSVGGPDRVDVIIAALDKVPDHGISGFRDLRWNGTVEHVRGWPDASGGDVAPLDSCRENGSQTTLGTVYRFITELQWHWRLKFGGCPDATDQGEALTYFLYRLGEPPNPLTCLQFESFVALGNWFFQMERLLGELSTALQGTTEGDERRRLTRLTFYAKNYRDEVYLSTKATQRRICEWVVWPSNAPPQVD